MSLCIHAFHEIWMRKTVVNVPKREWDGRIKVRMVKCTLIAYDGGIKNCKGKISDFLNSREQYSIHDMPMNKQEQSLTPNQNVFTSC